MQIIPAIDILDGNCVRLIQGDFEQDTIFSTDPLQMAIKWQSEGADIIHLVDLNGAKTGTSHNKYVIQNIVQNIHIPVQVGGGIRDLHTAQEMINLGVEKLVLGTSAINNPKLIDELLNDIAPERIIIALDGRDGRIAINGWQHQTDIGVLDLAAEMISNGIQRIMYTDISKDGVLEGPNLEITQQLTEISDLSVIASGGISSLEDIQRIKDIGCEGAILGKALYTGILKLSDAITVGT